VSFPLRPSTAHRFSPGFSAFPPLSRRVADVVSALKLKSLLLFLLHWLRVFRWVDSIWPAVWRDYPELRELIEFICFILQILFGLQFSNKTLSTHLFVFCLRHTKYKNDQFKIPVNYTIKYPHCYF